MPRPAAGVRGLPGRRTAAAVALGVVAAAVGGCGAAGREDAATAVAERFHAALAAGDAEAACEVLAPATRRELESASGTCAEALTEEDLPQAEGVVEWTVFGGGAQVRLDGDTVFLTRSDGPWFVQAAGCTPQQDLPYDCTIGGG